jgi:hypothetical protein
LGLLLLLRLLALLLLLLQLLLRVAGLIGWLLQANAWVQSEQGSRNSLLQLLSATA